jgi:signal peptidase I
MIRLLWWVPFGLVVHGVGFWRAGRRWLALLTWVVTQGSLSASAVAYSLSPQRFVWLVALATPLHLVMLVSQAFAGGLAARAPVARWWSVALFAVLTGAVNTGVNFVVTERLESFKVPSGSMRPSLVEGDQFFVLLDWERYPLERGAVIVFYDEKETAFVKRLVGLPGDRLIWDGQHLFVVTPDAPELELPLGTDELCVEPEFGVGARCAYEAVGTRRWPILTTGRGKPGEWEVPVGHVFVMGDNRDDSLDSRMKGPIPIERVVGRAEVIHFSWPNLSRVGKPIDLPGLIGE